MGTIWIFCRIIPCSPDDEFSRIVIQGDFMVNSMIT